jgi:hypothetical protein
MNTQVSKFKKQLVWFDEKSYDRAVKDAKAKINALEDCINWANYHITDIDPEEFSKDMIGYFYNKLGEQKPEFKKLGIKAEKIAGLIDIDVSELSRLQSIYMNAVGLIKFVGKKPQADVDKEKYKDYTANDEENKHLKVAKQLISAIEEVQKIKQVYPVQLVNGFNRFINYNLATQEWKFNKDRY